MAMLTRGGLYPTTTGQSSVNIDPRKTSVDPDTLGPARSTTDRTLDLRGIDTRPAALVRHWCVGRRERTPAVMHTRKGVR